MCMEQLHIAAFTNDFSLQSSAKVIVAFEKISAEAFSILCTYDGYFSLFQMLALKNS